MGWRSGKKTNNVSWRILSGGKSMKKDLLDILCCPTCKEDLDLKVDKEEKGEIIEGSFTCKKCNCSYSIEDGIPNLLPK